MTFPPGRLRRATIEVYLIDSVGEQAAVSGKVRQPKNRRDVAPDRRQYDRRDMSGHEPTRHDNKAASRLATKGDDGRFDLYVTMNGRDDSLDLEFPGRGLK